MEEVRQLVQEEGREARNLVAFHVAVDTPSRISRKPPRGAPPPRRASPRTATRLRSASAGRDKRSELRARYWALLFGDLQRSVGEIYNTVEAHENLNECQEVILVLENYLRDFKALGEWFRLKWEYDNTPPPQRPQSLAWEIRKTDFVRLESRKANSVRSSPSVSGKNSPCFSGHNTPSGKNSPSLTGKASPGSGKISPRISNTSPKANIEFFTNKVTAKVSAKPEPKPAKDLSRLSDIKEKDIKDLEDKSTNVTSIKDEKVETGKTVVEIGKAKECPNACPKMVVIMSPKRAVVEEPKLETNEVSSQAKATIAQLDAMENEFLAKNLTENQAKNENKINSDKDSDKSDEIHSSNSLVNGDEAINDEKDGQTSPSRSEDNFGDVSNESSHNENSVKDTETPSIDSNVVATNLTNDTSKDQSNATEVKDDVTKTTNESLPPEAPDLKKDDPKKTYMKIDKPNTRPAYSQAAAKPKRVTIAKVEVKTPARLIARSKTVAEIRSNSAPKSRQFSTKNQTNNKCSYPFNLTTGRTSLFDAPANKIVSKKPVNRTQFGAGDTKTKTDLKRPPRPTSLKINEKGDKKENNGLQKIKDCDEYSSTDTIVTQIDMSRIESSESLKTLIAEDMANSIEEMNINTLKDNDGWLTVKSKKSKSHWANRFHQPSATTSLPTLKIESPKQEINNITQNRAKSEQPQVPEVHKTSKPVEYKVSKKDPSIIRQKSDVTGLKTRTSKSKALRREKYKDTPKDDGSELTKNRLHSSLESLTTGLARSQESTSDTFDFDKWKAEFKSTFNFLDEDDQMPDHNEILKSADPSEMSEIAEMTSQIEENERKISLALDFQSEVDQRKLCEEEDLLNRQIMELQQVSDVDMDTETDDTETDAEILCEDTPTATPSTETLSSLTASLEDQYETALAGMSWAERVDTLGALEALVARDPGRAQQLHAKLSQGIKRRGSLQDALRRLQSKQLRAERQRMEYRTQRASKIHTLLAKVEEVKVAKNQLIEEKRLRMERRLQKAAENRDQHLKDRVRKAHDEEEKLREIAFIKQLEAENRRHEFLDQCRSHTTRLRVMRRDRLSKLEQKAAREAAVGARRQALEAARKLHVETLLEKRKERDARVEELKELKKQERDDAAREKAEGVKSRLSALAAAAELEADALRSRIRDKQDASQQRLESHLQAIREKATGPRQATTSESQDQISKEEKELQEETERLEQERREREKQKVIKRKARKIKQKLLASGDEDSLFEERLMTNTNLQIHTHRMFKVIHQIDNTIILSSLLHDVSITDGKKKKKSEITNNNNLNNNKDEKKGNVGRDEGKKKKKKNNSGGVSKGSSVCSSLSDVSKCSLKENKVNADMTALERQLNELHRLMEKAEKKTEKTMIFNVFALKVLGKLLSVAAESEDTMSQFPARCLTTAVVIISLNIPVDYLTANHFIESNTCVYIIDLLTHQLEKDLKSDQKELELAKQLADCLSIALDTVLCFTNRYEDKALDDYMTLARHRSRAHTLISYICLSGCLTRAEKAGEARESIQTLLTLCADLCRPCDIDTGSERASATQSIRCALGTDVCGFRAEFCMLFAHGAGLEHSGGFVKAARTAHLLRALAELDHQIVQEAFGEGGWPLEFRAAVASLLSQHAPSDKEAPRYTALKPERLDQTLSETLVLDLIVLVGFVVVNNTQLQETICDGWSVIKTLCTLPANWLVSKVHSHALLPTLVALSDRPTAAAAIASELSMEMLEDYIKSPEAQKIKLVQIIKQGRAKKGKK